MITRELSPTEPPTLLIHQYFYSNQNTITDRGRKITENCVKPNIHHICVDNWQWLQNTEISLKILKNRVLFTEMLASRLAALFIISYIIVRLYTWIHVAQDDSQLSTLLQPSTRPGTDDIISVTRTRVASCYIRQMAEANLLIPAEQIKLLDRVGQG